MNNEEKYKEAFDSLTEEACCEVNFTTKNEDLEEEIDKCWEGWIDPNPEVKIVAGYLSKDEFSTYARHFAEWQKQKAMQDFLEKAVEWLQDSLDRRYVVRNFHTDEYYSIQDMIKDFKNYMQDEM